MSPSEISITSVNRSEADAERYYSRLSSIYDLLAASEKKFINRGLELLKPASGETILEVGFGTGHAQLIIGKAVNTGLSAGVDLSAGMCRAAQKKAAAAGLSSRVSLIRNNSLPMPFSQGVMDGIFSSFTLELFDTPQIPEVLKEFKRVLKPGGRLVVVSLSKDQPLPWMGRLYEYLHTNYPRMLDCRPIPVKSIISEGGFETIQAQEFSMWGIPVSIVKAFKV